MAKRKRLSAANPAFAEMPPLETKSGFPGKAPIAGVAADAATTAALDEVTTALADARREGRMIIDLPISSIQQEYLVRDRVVRDDEAMEALVTSISERGQQVPIEVADLGDGRYGLISGWRRIQALTRLNMDTVQAVLRQPQEASDAYLSMIEENEIRLGLSYYERARIVVKAAEQGVFPDERAALAALFQSGSRARRSKIGTFMHIVKRLDGVLDFPGAIPERGGLELGRALQANPELDMKIIRALARTQPKTPEEELACAMAAAKGIDPNKARSESEPLFEDVRPCLGIVVKTAKSGALTLTGSGVDNDLREELLSWLRARG